MNYIGVGYKLSFVMLIEAFFLNFHIIKLFNHVVDSICSNITSLIFYFLVNERKINNPYKF
jgi:hypothetical protein